MMETRTPARAALLVPALLTLAVLAAAGAPALAGASPEPSSLPTGRGLPSTGPVQGPGVGPARWLPTLRVTGLNGSKLTFGSESASVAPGFESDAALPPPLDTGVGEGKLLAVIPSGTSALESSGQAPWVLLTGKPCSAHCDDERGLFAIRATGGRRHQFTFPGKIMDPKTGEKMFESRAFFGRCLADGKPVFVSFQRERIDRRHRLASSVYVGQFGGDMLDEQLISRGFPSLQTTLRKVRSGECTEIEGRNRLASSKMVDLRVKREDDEEDDAADDEGDEDLNSKLPGADAGKGGSDGEGFDTPFEGGSAGSNALSAPAGARVAAPFEWGGRNGAKKR